MEGADIRSLTRVRYDFAMDSKATLPVFAIDYTSDLVTSGTKRCMFIGSIPS